MNTQSLLDLRVKCDDTYYNTGEEIILDNEYDALRETICSGAENHIDDIGSVPKQRQVKLPFWMGSLDKLKTQSELDRWVKNSKYILTPKYDGISALLIMGNDMKLYTRGNGSIGSDISSLINYINNISDLRSKYKNGIFRGELIMKKSIFFKKYANSFSNPRNLVSGIVNGLRISSACDIDFVLYEIIGSGEITPLTNESSTIVNHTDINVDFLSSLLARLKTDYQYEVDGIVIQRYEKYIRNVSGNPTYMKAFKGKTESIETIVENVEWNTSKRGYLKPRIKVKTVHIGGVDISYATGFNAKFINDNGIGCGSRVEIVRSGDVIPYIKSVIQKVKPCMPQVPYEWDNAEIKSKDVLDTPGTLSHTDTLPREQSIQLLVSFFKALGTKNMGIGTITKLYDSGYNTVTKINDASMSDFANLENFGEKSVTRLYQSIHAIELEQYPISIFLGSFGIPNLGQKKAEILLSNFPNIINMDSGSDIKTTPKGISTEFLTALLSYMPSFKMFLENIGVNLNHKYHDNENLPTGKGSVVFTGFRDSDLECRLSTMGISVRNTVSKKTIAVIKDSHSDSNTVKIQKANQYNIPVYTRDEYLQIIRNIKNDF